jgi:glycosyltransferase involved in cell wall biosynthesis
MKKIAIVTDAWHPQINGVVTTLTRTARDLIDFGYQVKMITPEQFRTIRCPTYPEISLALAGPKAVAKELFAFKPNCVHIATEGPLGWAARSVCKQQRFSFTTSYHTRFPEYLRMRWPVPLRLTYMIVKAFHNAAQNTMVATKVLMQELHSRGFTNISLWARGVDTELFKPGKKNIISSGRPVFMYVGRVAVEKNIDAFLGLDLPGTKYVIGDGPARNSLSRKYPEVCFTGYRTGQELRDLFAAADVFVFPSRSDTFGVVLLEAMASGVPVAAYPVTGPIETVLNGVNGYLDQDLRRAALNALTVSPRSCREFAGQYSWKSCSRQFLDNLVIHDQPLLANVHQHHICARSDRRA